MWLLLLLLSSLQLTEVGYQLRLWGVLVIVKQEICCIYASLSSGSLSEYAQSTFIWFCLTVFTYSLCLDLVDRTFLSLWILLRIRLVFKVWSTPVTMLILEVGQHLCQLIGAKVVLFFSFVCFYPLTIRRVDLFLLFCSFFEGVEILLLVWMLFFFWVLADIKLIEFINCQRIWSSFL